MSDFQTYVDIDLHKTTLTIGALDPSREVRTVKSIDTTCTGKIVETIQSLPGPIAVAIESVGMYEWLWDLLEDSVDKLEVDKACVIREMNLIAKDDQFKTQFELLRSVPGIGPVISFIVLSEFANFERFHSADATACYTGLTERTEESAGVRKTGRISRCGNATLGWALGEAATTLIKHDATQKTRYEAIVKNKGGDTPINKKKAKIAMAQKKTRAIWRMMQTGEFFRKGEPTSRQAELNAKRAQKRASGADAAAAA